MLYFYICKTINKGNETHINLILHIKIKVKNISVSDIRTSKRLNMK